EISDGFRICVWREVGAWRGLSAETTEKIDAEVARLKNRGDRQAAIPVATTDGTLDNRSDRTTVPATFDLWGSDEAAFLKLHDGLHRAGLIDVDREQFRRSFRGECRAVWKGTLAQLVHLLFLLKKS